MRLNPPILEDRPQLRDRVFGLAAISAVVIGGAMAMDTIVTGGWQWGVASAATHQYIEDDTNQLWSEPAPPQPVALASYTTASSSLTAAPQPAENAAGLEGGRATVSLTSYKPQTALPALTQISPQAPSPIDEAAATARYNQIEAQVQQAMPQIAPEQPAQNDKENNDVVTTDDPN